MKSGVVRPSVARSGVVRVSREWPRRACGVGVRAEAAGAQRTPAERKRRRPYRGRAEAARPSEWAFQLSRWGSPEPEPNGHDVVRWAHRYLDGQADLYPGDLRARVLEVPEPRVVAGLAARLEAYYPGIVPIGSRSVVLAWARGEAPPKKPVHMRSLVPSRKTMRLLGSL